MNRCQLCQADRVAALLDCGEQPICNRFLNAAGEREARFPLVLGACENCGHIQLVRYPPADELRPRFGWISYNEPQGHLDQLVELIGGLPGITTESLVGAIVFGKDLTLERFAGRGLFRSWRIELAKDLGVHDRLAGVETLQGRLTRAAAEQIVRARGFSDVLVVRHLLEHAHDLRGFLDALRRLVRPGGYIAVEVPDCETAIVNHDYSVLWEEHIHYFTAASLRRCLEWCGLRVVRFLHPVGSLVAIAQFHPGEDSVQVPPAGAELERIREFAAALPGHRAGTGRFLTEFRGSSGSIALFGAGHQGCVFVNLLGLKDTLEFVVDDHPKKQGLFMAGSRLPVLGSSALVERKIRLCLSALSPESEARMQQSNQGFLEGGGCVLSIYPGRSHSLPV